MATADTSGVTKSAHKGFDRWWDSMHLAAQMWGRIFAMVFLVQGFIVSGIGMMVTTETQRSVTAAYYHAKLARNMYMNPIISFTIDDKDFELPANEVIRSKTIVPIAHAQAWKLVGIWMFSCLIYFAIPAIGLFFKEKTDKEMAVKHIRGPELLTVPELVEEIRASGKKTRLVFGGVPLPVDFESEHIGIFGKTRVGKSVLCYQLIEKIRSHKAVILDVKGDYVSKFYDPDQDVIFNILDERGAGWCIFNEIKNRLDVEAVGQSMIPDVKAGGNEQFFNDAARAVLVGGMFVCISKGLKTNKALRELVFNNTELMEQALNSVKEASRGHVFLQQPNGNLAGSVHAVLMQYVSWLEYMPDTGNFCLTDWINDGTAGFLFLSTKKEIAKTLQPVISLFVDLAARRILSWQDDPNRRVYFLLDEFGSLQRLNAFKDILTVGGGRGAVVIMTCQDFAQVREKYGKEDAETIFNSFGTILTLKLKDPNTAKFLSETFGKRNYWEMGESTILGVDTKASITQKAEKRDDELFTASEIQYLKKLEFFLQIPDFNPCKGILQILPVNNTPVSHPDFILRPGFELELIGVDEDALVVPKALRDPFATASASAPVEVQNDGDETSGLAFDAQAQDRAEKAVAKPVEEEREEAKETAEKVEDAASKAINKIKVDSAIAVVTAIEIEMPDF